MLSREPVILRQPLETESSEPLTEQDNELLAKHKEYRYMPEKMTWDPNCYECKVRYRDPKAKDLVMYLHAWRYKVIFILSYKIINYYLKACCSKKVGLVDLSTMAGKSNLNF